MASEQGLSSARRAYLSDIRRRERFIKAMRYTILIVLIVVWELAARIGWIDPFITSSPSRVINTILRLLQGGELFLHIGVTLLETVAGFLIGTAVGNAARGNDVVESDALPHSGPLFCDSERPAENCAWPHSDRLDRCRGSVRSS